MLREITGIIQGMKVKTFSGILNHKNPTCDNCGRHCFSLYRGGRKERLPETFVCKNCNIIYTLPREKKCEFTEVNA